MIMARAAPSSMPAPLLHLVLDPRMQRFVARRMANDRRVCTNPITSLYDLPHLMESLLANRVIVNRAQNITTEEQKKWKITGWSSVVPGVIFHGHLAASHWQLTSCGTNNIMGYVKLIMLLSQLSLA